MRWIVWTIWAVMLASDVYLVGRYGPNVPRLDDWFLVPALTGAQPITPAYLWSLHNEHRLVLPRLVLLGLAHLTGNDFRAGMFFNVAALAALAAGLILAIGKARGRTLLVDSFFPIVLLNWAHVGNLLWSWQVGFVLSTTLAGAFLITLIIGANVPTRQTAVLAGGCLLLLALCGANALLLVPPLAVWLGCVGYAWLGSAAPVSRAAGRWMLGFALAAIVLVGVYFIDYQGPRMYARPDLLHCLVTSLQFLSTSFGLIWVGWWPVWACAVCLALVAGIAAGALSWRRLPQERPRILGLGLFVAAMIELALGIGWGRAGCPGPMGLTWRYVTLSVPGLCAAFLLLALYGGKWARTAQIALFLLAAAMLWPNSFIALRYARGVEALGRQFAQDVQRYPPIVLVDNYRRSGIAPDPMDDLTAWIDWMNQLHRAGIGSFARMPLDPPLRTMPINAQTSEHIASNRYRLKHPAQVFAVRVRYDYGLASDPALLLFAWQASARQPPSHFQRELPREGRQDTVLIWIDGPVSEFSIIADARHPDAGAHIVDIDLLLPFNDGPR